MNTAAPKIPHMYAPTAVPPVPNGFVPVIIHRSRAKSEVLILAILPGIPGGVVYDPAALGLRQIISVVDITQALGVPGANAISVDPTVGNGLVTATVAAVGGRNLITLATDIAPDNVLFQVIGIL